MKTIFKTKKILFTAVLLSLSSNAFSEINVDQSNGVLSITSDIDGTVSAKIIGPDDKVVVDESFSGSSFSWSPSSGPDGAYRYDVRVNKAAENEEDSVSDYSGGSVEVVNGLISNNEEVAQ